jgi:hypothetical protein
MHTVLIEDDIPLAEFAPTFVDMRERLQAAINTLDCLGVVPEPTEAERGIARQLFTEDLPPSEHNLSPPGVVAQLAALLSEYDKTVVQSAAQLRIYITNRLLLESDSQDPRIRIKALEMLGKISDVGLFTDKTEITMRHRPTEELEQMLRERLTRVIDAEERPSASYTPASKVTAEDILGHFTT